MTRNWTTPAAVVLMVVLAGCAGGIGTTPASTTTTPSTDAEPTAEAGTVSFYISDERNDIDDFESLNVTVTSIGFKRAGDADEEDEEPTTTSETANTTTTANDTTTNTTTTTNDTTTTPLTSTVDEENEADAEDDGGEDWVTVDINDTTVDLTELKGANASLLANVSVPNGTYTTVFVEVGAVNGTLTTGEQANVKLPSGRLKLNKRFTVESGDTVDFVYDVTAIKAGKSGKYILKPVVSQSGTDVPIERTDDREEREDREEEQEREDRQGGPEREDREDQRASDDALNLSVTENVTVGETVTLTATRNGTAVANATVTVDGETVGTTEADGTLSVTVPDAEQLEVEVEAGGEEAERSWDLAGADDDGEADERDNGENRGKGN
jgi:hypothetical protein